METVKAVMDSLGVLPKLHLGIKTPRGAVSTGPHTVKFIAEPEGITGKDFNGKPAKFLRFEIEENAVHMHWRVNVLNKEGQPNYLLERLLLIKPGDVRILQMSKAGIKNFIDIREVGADSIIPDEDEGEEEELPSIT
jgi:hypothetical protein